MHNTDERQIEHIGDIGMNDIKSGLLYGLEKMASLMGALVLSFLALVSGVGFIVEFSGLLWVGLDDYGASGVGLLVMFTVSATSAVAAYYVIRRRPR